MMKVIYYASSTVLKCPRASILLAVVVSCDRWRDRNPSYEPGGAGLPEGVFFHD